MSARRPPRERAGERGVALVMSMLLMATLLMVASGGMLVTSSNVKATRNYRGAIQAHFVAESGLAAALQTVNSVGVVNMQSDVVTPWGSVFGSATRQFSAQSGYSYSVTAVANAGNPANAGRFIATATGPEGATNVVVANLVRSNTPSVSPGAVYLATDSTTNATFNGNAFAIDGNDHNYTGGAGPAAPVPGISTRNATNTGETTNSLSSQQRSNVKGLGYQAGPPTLPSVATSPAAPTVAQMNQIITDLLVLPHVTNSGGTINGNATFGTTAAPQITYFSSTSGVTFKGNGNASGAGIMIVEDNLTIQGTFAFKGLILVRGRTNVMNDPSDTTVTGNATVYGSIWTQDLNLTVGGSSIVYYSSQALGLANTAGGGAALPAPLSVTSLADCAELPATTGGCP